MRKIKKTAGLGGSVMLGDMGIDASKEQLNLAEKNYPDIELIQADATNFSLREPVDLVFSNAVFHWIDKRWQQDMLKYVYNALKENGGNNHAGSNL